MRSTAIALLLVLTLSLSSQDFVGNGDYFKTADYSITFSIGEPVVELLRVGTGDTIVYFLQGFQQPTMDWWWWIWWNWDKWGWFDKSSRLNDEASIYPNPTKDYCLIDIPSPMFMNVYSTDKQLVMKDVYVESGDIIDFSELTRAVYFIRLHNNNEVLTFKLLKQ